MKLQVQTIRELTITEEEFRKACEKVRTQRTRINNSFLQTAEEPTLDEFLNSLTYYLFTGEGDE